PLAQHVDGSVDVRVVLRVIPVDGLDDGPRLLRGGRVVQVDERFAVRLLIEDREGFADLPDVEPGERFTGAMRQHVGGLDAHWFPSPTPPSFAEPPAGPLPAGPGAARS